MPAKKTAKNAASKATAKKPAYRLPAISEENLNPRQRALLAESWNPTYAPLGFDADSADPPFLQPAVAELAKSDKQS